MKSINFINATPPKTRAALHRWFACSLMALLATLIALITLYIHTHYQYQKLWTTCQKLQHSKNQMLTFLQDKRMLKEQEQHLKEQQIKITHTQEKQKKVTYLVELLAQQHNTSVVLHHLELKKKLVTMTLQAKTSDDIVAYVKQLEQNKLFAQVTLQSLTAHEEHIQATVNAVLH